ncbi:MAG: hypothetical protein J6S29_00525, partial [Methanosphaera sp.]|nr:hypothetical protein [Methanosphaera sp.]
MKETHPLFINKKFKSILLAAIVEEMVVYIVSITDTIVAGNVIDSYALEIVGLAAPITTLILFITSIINSGTIRNYSLYVGSFNRKRANQYFSQGVFMAIAGGVLTAVILFFLRDFYIARLVLDSNGAVLLRSYYDV